MFEDANLFIGLDDDDSDKRLATIEQLRTAVRRGGGELPVHNLTQLFQLLSERLKDDDVDVAGQSCELLCDLLNRDLQTTDIYFPIVLPSMFHNLADDDRRDASLNVLTTYVEAMGSVECIMEGMVQHGLSNDEADIRMQTLLALPAVADNHVVPNGGTNGLTHGEYSRLMDDVIACLGDAHTSVVTAAVYALKFLQKQDTSFWQNVEKLGNTLIFE